MQLFKRLFAGFLFLGLLFVGVNGVFAQCWYDRCYDTGSIAVSASPNSPIGEYDSSAGLQTLGAFRIKAVGEPFRERKVNITVNGGEDAEGTIESLAIYNNAGTRISNEVSRLNSSGWDETPLVQTFTLDVTVPVNSYDDFYVKGVTSGITGPDPARIYVRLVKVDGKSVSGTGIWSKEDIFSSTTLALPLVSIRQPNREEDPEISSPRSSAAVEVRYDWRGILYAGSKDRQFRNLTVTANNYWVGITEVSLIVDNKVIASKVADPNSGSRTMTLSSSDMIGSNFTFDRWTASKVWIVVRANGVTGFRGNISVPGYSLPFYIFR